MIFVVGFDGSNSAKEALAVAVKHAKVLGAQLQVITSLKGGDQTSQDRINQAKAGLTFAEDVLAKEGVDGETHLLIRGRTAGEDLVQFAEEKQAELVFIGVRRRSKVGKLVFGSCSQFVILKAGCPVVSVK